MSITTEAYRSAPTLPETAANVCKRLGVEPVHIYESASDEVGIKIQVNMCAQDCNTLMKAVRDELPAYVYVDVERVDDMPRTSLDYEALQNSVADSHNLSADADAAAGEDDASPSSPNQTPSAPAHDDTVDSDVEAAKRAYVNGDINIETLEERLEDAIVIEHEPRAEPT